MMNKNESANVNKKVSKVSKENKKTSGNKRRKQAEGFTIKELLGDLEIKF